MGMDNWLKPWSDMFKTWSQAASSYSPEEFAKIGPEGWFKPYREFMDNWSRAYQGFADMSKGSATPVESMKDLNQAIARSINSYVSIHDAWLRSMDSAARQGYEIGRKLMAGEEVEIGPFFDTIKSAYDDSTNSIMEALKETPFAVVEEIDRELKNSIDSFPEEQEITKGLVEEMLRLNARMINLTTSATKEFNGTLSKMLEEGTISSDAYKAVLDAYAETMKHCIEIMRPPAALLPEYKATVDAATNCAATNLDMMTSWIEINLKLYEGIAKSAGEISKSSSEILKAETPLTPAEFYDKWVTLWQDATGTLIQNTHFNTSVPTFVRKYTEWVKSVQRLYGSVTAIPYATKEDIDELAHELGRGKTPVSVGKKSKHESKPE
ncbi:MAG: hypothetical protein FJY85_21150, partial [Deltaproteobacteria bacterium]|nr:hypothetical protein [Deltaproteobacteria bacterium]